MLEQSFIFITGKGGTGKTTVAAALATAAAAAGRRALVCDLAGGRQLQGAFGRRSTRRGEARLAERIWALPLDPDAALREWLRRQPGGALVAGALGRSEAFSHFVAAAPGAKELVTIGKAADLAGRDAGATASRRYDLVLADAASTGHALGMLAAPLNTAHAVARGPVAAQARQLADHLKDPDRTAYVGVALPEEMATRETLALERGLRATLGRSLDLVVVNGVYPDRFSDEDAHHLRTAAERGCHARLLYWVLDEHHHRARAHADQVRWLRRRTDTPVVTLPFVFTRELGPSDYALLGSELVAQLGDALGGGFHPIAAARPSATPIAQDPRRLRPPRDDSRVMGG